MPSGLPCYDHVGDPVEAAISRSHMAPHRRSALIAEYQRLLYEQVREEAAELGSRA
jgi:hypothetical protein